MIYDIKYLHLPGKYILLVANKRVYYIQLYLSAAHEHDTCGATVSSV